MTHETSSDTREDAHDPASRYRDRDREIVAQLESALASATVRRERRSRTDERG